ncbi:MAG: RnfABCDGE type electron transport complex subunit D [Bacteroidota bacterium]|nr:RnfABCDGE type electron transport complex subunit D [Bacteroidota bacterium]
MSKFLTISASPHVYGETNVKRLMFDVVFALIPALGFSIYFFGWGAIQTTLVAIISCITFEFLIQKYFFKKPVSITDGSALLTGLLLAFNLPSSIPIWIIIIGSLVAIGVGKMSFGGLGSNPFNPALVGRVFLLISFPVQMTTWPIPKGFATVDAVTGATPLGYVKEGLDNGEAASDLLSNIPSHMEMFYGHMGGSMGEMAAAALLLGFVYLLVRKVITWHIPVSIFATITVFTGILWAVNPEQFMNPLFHLITGGVMLGAIFMATDYVTSPMSVKGMWIYGIGIGVITVLIRVFGAYPEGVSFAILIMNAFVPLINTYIKPKRFGEEVNNG